MVPRFRGRNIETGEWVYGHLFYFDDGRHFISPTGTDVVGGYGGAPAKYRLENLVCFEIKPETVGQSTGYKDKNGVEIFEGDLVKVSVDNGFDYLFEELSIVKPSKFHSGLVCSLKSHEVEYRIIHAEILGYEYEVVGNIYENPELLEQANEN